MKFQVHWRMKFQVHGMGVATAVLYKEGNRDIRLHYWNPNHQVEEINQSTGAIHWHSFFTTSHVLEGKGENVIFDYDPVFPASVGFSQERERLAIGDDLWDCWEYTPENQALLVGSGWLQEVRRDALYVGKTYTMPPRQYHTFALQGPLFTLVCRDHTGDPNHVLTHQKATLKPPVNGREAGKLMKADLTGPVYLQVPSDFGPRFPEFQEVVFSKQPLQAEPGTILFEVQP
jgi:hypothetical protein